MAQARQPAFYRDLGVADTLGGRFELVLLHTVLAVRRLRREGREGQRLGQAVFERFCSDMDDTLREIGISDVKVPKQMQKVGGAFYERQDTIDAAMAAGDHAALTAQMERGFPGISAVGAAALAAYIGTAAESLEAQPAAALVAGEVSFPAVGTGPLAA